MEAGDTVLCVWQTRCGGWVIRYIEFTVAQRLRYIWDTGQLTNAPTLGAAHHGTNAPAPPQFSLSTGTPSARDMLKTTCSPLALAGEGSTQTPQHQTGLAQETL